MAEAYLRTPTMATGGITGEEKKKLTEHARLWIDRAMRTTPIEPDKIISAIKQLYKTSGLEEPRVVIVPSPLSMAFAYGASCALLENEQKLKQGMMVAALAQDLSWATSSTIREQAEAPVLEELAKAGAATRGETYRDLQAKVHRNSPAGQVAFQLIHAIKEQVEKSGKQSDEFEKASELPVLKTTDKAADYLTRRQTSLASSPDWLWRLFNTLLAGVRRQVKESSNPKTVTRDTQVDSEMSGAVQAATTLTVRQEVTKHLMTDVGLLMPVIDAVHRALDDIQEDTELALTDTEKRRVRQVTEMWMNNAGLVTLGKADDKTRQQVRQVVRPTENPANHLYRSVFEGVHNAMFAGVLKDLAETLKEKDAATVVAQRAVDLVDVLIDKVNVDDRTHRDIIKGLRAVTESSLQLAENIGEVIHEEMARHKKMPLPVMSSKTDQGNFIDRAHLSRATLPQLKMEVHTETSDRVSAVMRHLLHSLVSELHIALKSAVNDIAFDCPAATACFHIAGIEGVKKAADWYKSYQGGNLWAFQDSYLTAMRDVIGLKLPEYEKYAPWEEAAIHGAFRCMHPSFCIVSDFPKTLRVDAQNRPHCEFGPSHEWRDGWALYHWHGTVVPKEWIEEKDKLSAETALTWQNIEQRRCACEILGWHKILKELKAKKINKDGDPEIGELVEVEIPQIGKARFLRVQCGTKREFALPVPLEMKTALQAQAWTWGLDETDFMRPEIRT